MTGSTSDEVQPQPRAVPQDSDECDREVGRDRKNGTFHQSDLGPKTRRKLFFSPLDPSLADAVHLDAESVEYSEKEEKAVKRKIDNKVLPLVICSYIFNQFDRTNILCSYTQKHLKRLSCLLEMPANVLQRRIGANRFFFLSLTFLGISSLSVVYAKEYAALLVLRVLMGIGEAGYYAGMIYYLSFWYKRDELAMRISLCMTGTFPGAIGGLLAFGLVRGHTSLITGWQFLFLIEAIPTIIMASMILFFLPSFPFSATFLTPRERAIAQARLNRHHKPQSHGGMTGWQGFKVVVADLNAWLFMLIYASFNVGVATISYFLPTLINDLGFSSINAQGMTVAPYAVGWLIVFFQATHSDYTRDRGYHVMLSCSISFIGYVILATSVQESVGAAYFALFLVVGGNYSLFPLVMSWAANAFSPTSKRGVGTAFIVSISNCVSIASPQIYFDPEDNYRKGRAFMHAYRRHYRLHLDDYFCRCLLLSFLTAFILRTRLALLNTRNKKHLESMTQEERDGGGAHGAQEVWDNDPRYIFRT